MGHIIKDLEISEYQKNKLVEEVQELRSNQKRFSQVIEIIRASEEELKKNLFNSDSNKELLRQEKIILQQELNKCKQEYEKKLKETQELADLRVQIYEKSYRSEQESCLKLEEKTLNLLDKQEQVICSFTNK